MNLKCASVHKNSKIDLRVHRAHFRDSAGDYEQKNPENEERGQCKWAFVPDFRLFAY